MTDVATLIANAVSRGGLNLSDIARWLETPLPTVREWADGTTPRKYKIEYALNRLRKLNELVDAHNGPLIPASVKQPDRALHIEKLRDEQYRVLQKDIA
jgi:hypothetical protein